jgi:hypothetical protein
MPATAPLAVMEWTLRFAPRFAPGRVLLLQRAAFVRCAPGVFAALLCIVACAGLPAVAQALSLHHMYSFDPGRVRIAAGAEGTHLQAEGLPVLWERGEPELPYDTITWLVPQGSRITSVHVRASNPVVLASGRLALAAAMPNDAGAWLEPKPARLTAAAMAQRGSAALQAAGYDAALYPAVQAEPAGGGALHGYQLVSLRVFPVRYDTARQQVLAARQLDIEIELSPGGALPLQRERFSAGIEADARRSLQGLVVNPGAIDAYGRRIGQLAAKSTPGSGFHPSDAPSLEGSPVEYVIVTSEALAPAWQALADWKTQRGVPTVVRTLEWIGAHYRHGSDLQETIRTFIQDAYAKWGAQYVLLAGDTDVIPARYGFSGFGETTEQSIPTDMYFACLDGNWNFDGDALFGEAAVELTNPGDSTDLYAEVFVGRAPLSTLAEVSAFIGKVTTYENPPNTTYQRQLLMLGEVLAPVDWQPGDPLTLDGGVYSQQMLAFVTTGCVDTLRLYQNWTAFPGSEPLTRERVLAEMSAGKGFVNHIGHGYRYNMSVGDVSMTNTDALALTNGDKRFILYMLNCTASAFDFPCLAEAFLKSPGGAVTVIGSTRSAYALPAANYNREFFKALYTNGYEHLGEAFVQSRLVYTPNATFDNADHYSHYLYNYLGDPEMVAHTCSLGTTAAAFDDTIGLGSASIAVHVTVDGAAREDALVCLMKGAAGTEAYASGSTDASGDVTLPLRAESAGSVTLTVSGQNMRTLQASIAVVPQAAPYLHVTALGLDDDATGGSLGNADGKLDAGETFEADLTGTNDGPSSATSVTGVLRIASSWATVADSAFVLGNVGGSGASAQSNHEVRFTVAAGAPDGTVLPLTFVMTDGIDTWTDVVHRVVHAPSLRVTRLAIDDFVPGGNGDGRIQAGETFDLLAYFKNYGSGAADGLSATLASSDPDITIVNGAVAIGRDEPLAEVTGATRFRLTESVLAENALDLDLTDSQARTNHWTITLRGPAKPAKPVPSTKSGAGVVTLAWTPSVETDLAGYHVYRSLSASGPWTRISVDQTLDTAYYRDPGLAASTHYFYYVTALDTSGNESVPSDVADINTNPPQLSGWPIQLGASSSCPVAVGDITGDGSKEIVAGNDHLYAWNWSGLEVRDDDADPLTWGVFSKEVKTVTGAVALADMDTNPGLEVFATAWDDTNKAFALRGDGSLLAGWHQNPDPGTSFKGYWAASAAVDVDGDGRAELFGPAKNGNLYAWHADGTPLGASVQFKSGLGFNQRTSPSFANLDADPELEIVFGAQNGQLFIWNADGSNFPHFPVTPGTLCISNTAIGDVNHDGILDVVMLTEGGLVNVYSTATGTQLPGWPRSLTIKGNPISPSPALADFDGDGYLEVVVANNGGNSPSLSSLRVFDSQGNTLPGWPRSVGGYNSESSPIVADISGDGVPDVLFGNEGGLLYGWNKNGADLPGFPITIGDFVRSTPFVDDIDGDGSVDLVLAGWDKNVYVFDFPVAWYPAAAQWPTLKHDAHRSGTYGFVFDIAPPAAPTSLLSTSHTPGAWSNDPTVDVTWSGASDPSGIGGYSYVWDTSAGTLPDATIDTMLPDVTSPPLGEGQSHWFHVRTVDTHGNWTPTALHLGPFWIDVTPPSGVAALGADRPPGVWSQDNTIDASWLPASDAGSAPARKAGTAEPRGKSAAFATLGTTTLVATGPGVATAAAPAPHVAGSGVGGYSVLWSTDDLDVPDASIETSDLAATSPPLADGNAWWLHVRAVDAAGNPADAAATAHLGPFWVDATPPTNPTTIVTTPPAGTWSAADTIFASWSGASDALSGLAGYSFAFDATPATLPDTTIDTAGNAAFAAPVADGLHWLHLRTRDAAGNWAAAVHAGAVQIDRTAPAAVVVSPNGGEVWAHNSVQTVRWQASDAAAGITSVEIRYSNDGGSTFPVVVATPAPTDSTYDWTVPLDVTGTARLQVRVTDGAGNLVVDASDADFALTTATDAGAPPVTRTWLEPAAPNPFNPQTVLRYSLLETGPVRLVIYDARGRLVRTLVHATQAGPRWYEARWDGRDDHHQGVPSGVYFATFAAKGLEATQRLVLVR